MKNSIIKRMVSLILVIAAIMSMFCTSASAASTNVIRYNISTSAVSCNASAGSLPSSKTSLTGGSSYYFNVQVSSSQKLSKAKLYIMDVGESSYTCVHTETASNYMRYVYYKYKVNNTTGTLKYYWSLWYTDGTTKTTSKTSVKVTATSTSTSTSSYTYPVKNYYETWGESTSWAANCLTGYGRDNGSGRNYHIGIDLASSSGNTNVYAFADGTVKAVGYNSSNGNYVIIQHKISGKTVYSFYAHLASYCVSKGDSVSTGTKIGKYGNSGSAASGSIKHLHFAVMDTLKSAGSYYGYATSFSGNKTKYSGVTYYNPSYIIKYEKLPS